MKKHTKFTALILLNLFAAQCAFSQKLDRNIYLQFVNADSTGFIAYARSINYNLSYDGTSRTLFAKTPGFVFSKPLNGDNEYYSLALIVSTPDKANNDIIINNAKPVEGKEGTWARDKFLYMEFNMDNPYSKEKWYRLLVYKQK